MAEPLYSVRTENFDLKTWRCWPQHFLQFDERKADFVKILVNYDKILFLAASEEAVEQWRAKLLEAENMLQQLEERLEQLEQENKQLQEIIEPFRDQLESFEIEKNALLSQVLD